MSLNLRIASALLGSGNPVLVVLGRAHVHAYAFAIKHLVPTAFRLWGP